MPLAYPDTLVGTDSHTTMINGLGVLGWGVGGIEAEAAMLGQPVSMLIPQVVGFRLTGALPEGATATDLVLTVTQMLRKKGVVGQVRRVLRRRASRSLPLADRATIANMAPEYGATCGIFPVDAETLALPALHRAARPSSRAGRGLRQGAGPLPRRRTRRSRVYSDTLELDLAHGRAEPRRARGARRTACRSDGSEALGLLEQLSEREAWTSADRSRRTRRAARQVARAQPTRRRTLEVDHGAS